MTGSRSAKLKIKINKSGLIYNVLFLVKDHERISIIFLEHKRSFGEVHIVVQ